MIIEIRKYYIFLIFLLMHALFWMNYEGRYLGDITQGDWTAIWQNITQLENYSNLLPYSKIFYVIEEITGKSLYIGIVIFSFLNTLFFIVVVKILEVFDKQGYSVIVASIMLFAPSSLIIMLSMYKDNLSNFSFALILLIIARLFSAKQLSILKAWLLYISGIFLTLLSRDIFVWYITLLLSLSLFLSFFLLLSKSYSFKSILPVVTIFLFHMMYFYGGLNNGTDFKISETEFYTNGQLKSEINYEEDAIEGKFRIWSPSGDLILERRYKNGKLDGKSSEWYLNGQLKSESYFKKDKLDGLFEEWYANGQKKLEANYKNGILEGAAFEWYENGQKKLEANYKKGMILIKLNNLTKWYEDGALRENFLNGKKEGLWVERFDNGQTKSLKLYKNDFPEGQWTQFDQNGDIKLLQNYENGNLISLQYPNGKLKSEISYANGKLDGKTTDWYESGQKSSEISYANGKLDGKTTEWYESGQKSSETSFKKGMLEGKKIHWYENGQKKFETFYKKGDLLNSYSLFHDTGHLVMKFVNGKKEGVWHTLYINKEVKSAKSFKNGKLDGPSIEWYKNGKIKSKVNYKNGQLNGQGILYYSNGQVKSETSYKDGKVIGKLVERFEDGKTKSETSWEIKNNFFIGFKATIQEIYKNNNEIRNIQVEHLLNNFKSDFLLQLEENQLEENQLEENQLEENQQEELLIELYDDGIDVLIPKIFKEKAVQKKTKQELLDSEKLQTENFQTSDFSISEESNSKIIELKDWYFSKIRDRKSESIACCPNAELNYDDAKTLELSNTALVISHAPKVFFAPNIMQIIISKSPSVIKTIFIIETLFYYICALFILYFFIRPKLYFKNICFIIVLYSCMFVTILADSNYGAYLRHAFIFNKVFLGLGLLNILYFFKLDFKITIKKGFL